MRLRALAKINLGLDVVGKRDDGYHEVRMIMQTIQMYDVLEIEKKKEPGIVLTTNIPYVPTDERNLVYKTAKMLMDEFKIKDGVNIYINKRIPIAGGMAGGSSDCATTLMGINQLFELGLSKEELMERGVKLGADVPYCVLGGTAIARGIGEVLTPLPAPADCHVIIAKPPVSVSTAYVYGHIKPLEITKRPDIKAMAQSIKDGDLKKMASLIYNVMEDVTVVEYPIISEIKQVMLDNGALNSIMSGSGPTVFGLFDDKEKAQQCVKTLEEKGLTQQLYLTKFHNE